MLSQHTKVAHGAQCPLTHTRSLPFSALRRVGLSSARRLQEPAAERRLRFRAARAVAEPAQETPAEAPPQPNVPKATRRGPAYLASFLWLEGTIGVAVDQVFSQGQRSPLTEYYLWPRTEAWDDLQSSLTTKTWIAEADRNDLLNTTTAVFEYWQEEPKPSLDDARKAFPESVFIGA